MTITPQDIQSKQFHVRLRGFDVDEVDKFLETVAEEFLILSLEHKQAMERITNLEKEVANFRNKEQAFQSAILSAQKISDEMQDKSRRESEEILQMARDKAAELESKSREESETMLFRAAQEAEETKEKAEKQARSLVENSSSRMLELTSEINRLISMKGRIMGDLRQLLDGYLARLEEGVPEGLENLEPLPVPEVTDTFLDSGGETAQPEQTSATEADTEEATADEMTGASADNGEELEDLYEKIDLPNDMLGNQDEPPARGNTLDDDDLATLELSDIEALELDDDQSHADIAISRDSELDLDPEIAIPDLNEDTLFSLEDPLDELEPSISIRDDSKIG